MRTFTLRLMALAALFAGAGASTAAAQARAPQDSALAPAAQAAAASARTICGIPVPPPANLPPAGSGPLIYLIAPCFPTQGNVSTIDSQTYLYYMDLAKRPT